MKSVMRRDTIVRALRRRGTTTVDALARDVGASRSTILRDLSALRDEGFVIHTEQGRGGGLYLDPSSVQATARLSVIEVFALIIGVASMRAARTLPFSSLADAGVAKIEKALPADKLRDLRRLLDCLYIGPLAPQVDISNLGEMDPALLPAFETSFLNRRFLRFRYRDAQGVESERQVEPQAMLILPPLWYLVAWDPARGDFRHFRMDRIIQPDVIDGTAFRSRRVRFDSGVQPVRYA